MDGIEKQKSHFNRDLVWELFRMLFQTLWISRFDPRRGGVYTEFCKTAMLLSSELMRNDITLMDEKGRRRIGVWLSRLSDDIVTMETTHVITDKQATEARAALCRVAEAMKATESAFGADASEESVSGASKTE